ncbi:hypothetical protein [Peribacillus deserti]|uniref:Uncharacterized protein n=1 Tax=Peribacillus deserti TaxID=673318 RepID=A0A2N5MAC8_9BACI|nr:hypothetical protein [Peribacillus deserti]PLT31255.1 hypothetical protein CUU66_03510 [Peribacillus deserti]
MQKSDNDCKRHPTITRCLQHLCVIGADEKTKQIVYMYLEALYRDLSASTEPLEIEYPFREKHKKEAMDV